MTAQEIHQEYQELALQVDDRQRGRLVKRAGVWREPGARGLPPNHLHHHESVDPFQDYAGNWTMRGQA